MAGLTARALTKKILQKRRNVCRKADELRLISLQLAKDEARLAILEQQYGKIKAQYMRVMGQIKIRRGGSSMQLCKAKIRVYKTAFMGKKKNTIRRCSLRLPPYTR